MKNGKKPNKNQSIFLESMGYNGYDFLVERDTPDYMIIVDRETKEVIKINK